MIPAVASRTFGQWLGQKRRETIDPTTGRAFTQARVAELLDVSTSKVAGWEQDEIKSISPDDAHRLAEILQVSEVQILQAVGFKADPLPLKDDERDLLEAYRRLSPILQETARRVIRAMPEPIRYRGTIRRSPRRASPE